MPTPSEYQQLLAGGCPWCGEALTIKIGKYGEFIACSNWCGFTKNVPGRGNYPTERKGQRTCPYKQCDGSGLIPFQKNGRIIPNAFIDCDCSLDNSSIPPLTLEEYDFDYPMSESFRAASFQYCGVPDPGTDKPQEPRDDKPPPQSLQKLPKQREPLKPLLRKKKYQDVSV